MMYQQINDEGATPAERLGALREYLASHPGDYSAAAAAISAKSA